MKIALRYFIDECLYYPSKENSIYRFFCIDNYNFYYDIRDQLITEKLTEKQRKKRKIKTLIPVIKINIIELMEDYLKSINTTKEEIIEIAKKHEPDNITWSEDDESVFDVAFRIYIDINCITKNGKTIELSSDWFDFRDSVCLPIIKKWCADNKIKWYDNNFEHFLHRWHSPWIHNPDKNDCFYLAYETGIEDNGV